MRNRKSKINLAWCIIAFVCGVSCMSASSDVSKSDKKSFGQRVNFFVKNIEHALGLPSLQQWAKKYFSNIQEESDVSCTAIPYKKGTVVGCENFGNTCYLNTLLTMFLYNQSFTAAMREIYHDVEILKSLKIHHENQRDLLMSLVTNNQAKALCASAKSIDNFVDQIKDLLQSSESSEKAKIAAKDFVAYSVFCELMRLVSFVCGDFDYVNAFKEDRLVYECDGLLYPYALWRWLSVYIGYEQLKNSEDNFLKSDTSFEFEKMCAFEVLGAEFRQHDVGEAALKIFECISMVCARLNDLMKKKSISLHRITTICMRTEALCEVCANKVFDDEIAQSILEVPLKEKVLGDCLNDYFNGAAERHCVRCQKNQQHEISTKITQALPPLVCINIGRYCYNKEIGSGSKNMSGVSFSLQNFSLSRYLDAKTQSDQKDVVYDLVGLGLHRGCDLESGHWASNIKQGNGEWVYCSDEVVQKKVNDGVKMLSEGFFHPQVPWTPVFLLYEKSAKSGNNSPVVKKF